MGITCIQHMKLMKPFVDSQRILGKIKFPKINLEIVIIFPFLIIVSDTYFEEQCAEPY